MEYVRIVVTAGAVSVALLNAGLSEAGECPGKRRRDINGDCPQTEAERVAPPERTGVGLFTNPKGADVYQCKAVVQGVCEGGDYIGTTPLYITTKFRSPGTYHFSFVLDEHVEEVRSVQITSTYRAIKTITLRPWPELTFEPAESAVGADLWLDGEVVGRLPLKRPLVVMPGVRMLRATKDGYDAWERQDTFNGDDRRTLKVEVTRQVGALKVEGHHLEGVPVYLDPPEDKCSGAAGGFVGRTPLTIKNIAVGTHTVVTCIEGLPANRQLIVIPPGKLVTMTLPPPVWRMLADSWEDEENVNVAEAESDCHGNEPDGCVVAAHARLHKKEWLDPLKAEALYSRACRRNVAAACHALGYLLETQRTYYFEMACRLGHFDACWAKHTPNEHMRDHDPTKDPGRWSAYLDRLPVALPVLYVGLLTAVGPYEGTPMYAELMSGASFDITSRFGMALAFGLRGRRIHERNVTTNEVDPTNELGAGLDWGIQLHIASNKTAVRAAGRFTAYYPANGNLGVVVGLSHRFGDNIVELGALYEKLSLRFEEITNTMGSTAHAYQAEWKPVIFILYGRRLGI